MTFQDMVGKTIKSIDTSISNCVIITFSDDTTVQIYAECGAAPFAIPFFEIFKEDN